MKLERSASGVQTWELSIFFAPMVHSLDDLTSKRTALHMSLRFHQIRAPVTLISQDIDSLEKKYVLHSCFIVDTIITLVETMEVSTKQDGADIGIVKN